MSLQLTKLSLLLQTIPEGLEHQSDICICSIETQQSNPPDQTYRGPEATRDFYTVGILQVTVSMSYPVWSRIYFMPQACQGTITKQVL